MYKIFVEKEDEQWLEVEESNQPIELVVLRVLELEKITGEVYRIEEISDLGNKIIELK